MTRQKWLILIVALVLMAGTAGALNWLRGRQKLGQPGIKATPIPGSVVMKIDLPERVLDFTSTNVPPDKTVLDLLPEDTSYAQRHYQAPDGFDVSAFIILMGADRTSIHRPEYCLAGQGFAFDEKKVVNMPIAGPEPYQLPVAEWKISGVFQQPDGRKVKAAGVYVFWFVADNEQTTGNVQLQCYLVRDLLLAGVLQRWAYIAYYSICAPGQENPTFERMKKLIAASVPEYQLMPKGKNTAAARH
jgi:hypothetical protein